VREVSVLAVFSFDIPGHLFRQLGRFRFPEAHLDIQALRFGVRRSGFEVWGGGLGVQDLGVPIMWCAFHTLCEKCTA
jgi:hypothetical protein